MDTCTPGPAPLGAHLGQVNFLLWFLTILCVKLSQLLVLLILSKVNCYFYHADQTENVSKNTEGLQPSAKSCFAAQNQRKQ